MKSYIKVTQKLEKLDKSEESYYKSDEKLLKGCLKVEKAG